MGILDDAIREHLDLMRRRGADPAEVERAEHEALDPVRRGAEPRSGLGDEQSAGLADLSPVSDELLPGQESEEIYADEEPRYGDEVPRLEEPELDWEDPAAHSADTAMSPPPVAGTPAWPSRGDDEPPPGVSDETVEYRIPDDSSPAPHRGDTGGSALGEGEEDVLEETPDFLQDTPDHDRLWFEQKPPRDFDFEG